MIRLGGSSTIAVVHNPKKPAMGLLNHNGLDVATREEVDECHRILSEGKDKWGLKTITKPADQARHLLVLLLGPRRKLVGDPRQPEGRL